MTLDLITMSITTAKLKLKDLLNMKKSVVRLALKQWDSIWNEWIWKENNYEK
jgi:hypothetical protein